MYRKNFLYRKKIIGGSLIGDIWNTAKNVISTGAKMAWDTGKELINLGTSKAITAGKDLLKEQAGVVQEKVSDFTRRGVKNLIDKAKEGVSKRLTPQMKETIQTIATNPKVKKILTDKTKQVLAKAPINENSRAILSNLIAGSGVKRLK